MTFLYAPPSFRRAVVLSVLSWAVLLAVLLTRRRGAPTEAVEEEVPEEGAEEEETPEEAEEAEEETPEEAAEEEETPEEEDGGGDGNSIMIKSESHPEIEIEYRQV